MLVAVSVHLSFSEHILKTRVLSRKFKGAVEERISVLCPVRLLYYNMKPGYVYPARNNRVVQMANQVHLFLWHYFPDYNQWLFNYILGKELYLCADELNENRMSHLKQMMAGQKIKYLRLSNVRVPGICLHALSMHAERICFKNVVFEQLPRKEAKSEC